MTNEIMERRLFGEEQTKVQNVEVKIVISNIEEVEKRLSDLQGAIDRAQASLKDLCSGDPMELHVNSTTA